jgi:hypothetical protein
MTFDFGAAAEAPVNPADLARARVRAALQSSGGVAQSSRPPRPPKKPKTESAKAEDVYRKKTREFYEGQGYNVTNADYFDHLTKRKHDFVGCFDLVAFGDGETVAVQFTSISNMSARKTKVLDRAGYRWVKRSGWKVVILGWEMQANGQYAHKLWEL